MIGALRVVCRDRTTEGDACPWVHDLSSTVESPFCSFDSFTNCQGEPHPAQFIPLTCDQTSCCNSLRKGVDLIQSNSGSWTWVDWAGIPPLLPICEGKNKRKQNTINFLSCFPPLYSLSHFSLFHPVCGNRVVCSVATLDKVCQQANGLRHLPCSLFHCTGSKICKTSLNVMGQFWLHVLLFFLSFFLFFFLIVKYFHVNGSIGSGCRSPEYQHYV